MLNTKIKASILLASIGCQPAFANLVNGNFEDGLTGWTTTISGGNSVSIATGDIMLAPGQTLASPTADQYAYTSQNSPGYSLLSQAFTVQSGVNNVFFDISIRNSSPTFNTPAQADTLNYATGINQQARFEILKPGTSITSVDPADIITTIYQTQAGDTQVQDWTTQQADITAALADYVGQDVIFRFSQIINVATFTLAIDNVSVELTQIAQILSTLSSAAAAGNRNALSPATVIDGTPDLLALFVGLAGDDRAISNAIDSTMPGVSGGVSQMTNIATNAITGVVSSRQDLTRGLSSGDGIMTDRNLWIKPLGGKTEQDNRQGVTGYDIDSYGLVAGFDGDVSALWNVGFALAYINSDVESNLVAGSHNIDMDSYQAKVYATKMFDDVTALNLQVGLGLSDYDSTRLIFNGDVASADYDSWNVQLSAELERSYQVNDKTVMTPYVHADYSYVDVDSYSETGAGALNLNVQDDSADSLIIGAGLKANHTVTDSLSLMVNAGVGYDVMAERSSITSSFAGGGANFTTEGIDPDEFVYKAGISAKYSLVNGTEITANYNINGREGYTDQSVSANFRWMF
jgi:outer membrane autotransporter protein